MLKKLLLLECDPEAGEPLVGALIGFRKLTVGDRHWRIVWRVTTDDLGTRVVEIAEVWAAGARSDAAVHAEMKGRVADLPRNPRTQALAEVVTMLGRAAGDVDAAREVESEPVPQWLVERLVHTAGWAEDEVRAMDPESAMVEWRRTSRARRTADTRVTRSPTPRPTPCVALRLEWSVDLDLGLHRVHWEIGSQDTDTERDPVHVVVAGMAIHVRLDPDRGGFARFQR